MKKVLLLIFTIPLFILAWYSLSIHPGTEKVPTEKMVPVTCGTSYKNKGVQKLLDAIVEYMPSPLDVPPVEGKHPKTDETEVREADDSAPFSALAFKIMTDPYVGKLGFFRVYSGTLESGKTVMNSTKGQRERIGRILQMHANHKDGVIAEAGTHDELLAKGGTYRELYETQFRQILDREKKDA